MLHDSRDLFLQIVLLASEAMRIDSGIIEKDYYVYDVPKIFGCPAAANSVQRRDISFKMLQDYQALFRGY